MLFRLRFLINILITYLCTKSLRSRFRALLNIWSETKPKEVWAASSRIDPDEPLESKPICSIVDVTAPLSVSPSVTVNWIWMVQHFAFRLIELCDTQTPSIIRYLSRGIALLLESVSSFALRSWGRTLKLWWEFFCGDLRVLLYLYEPFVPI